MTDHQNDPQDVCQFYLDGFGDYHIDVTGTYVHLRQHTGDHTAGPGHADVAFEGGGRSGASGGDRQPSSDGVTRPRGIAGEMVTVP